MDQWDKFFARADILGGVMEIHPKNRTGENPVTYRGTIRRIDRSSGQLKVELRNVQKIIAINGENCWVSTNEKVPCTFEMNNLMGTHRPQLDFEGKGNWWIIYPTRD